MQMQATEGQLKDDKFVILNRPGFEGGSLV
jgi:hypothetical protein